MYVFAASLRDDASEIRQYNRRPVNILDAKGFVYDLVEGSSRHGYYQGHWHVVETFEV